MEETEKKHFEPVTNKVYRWSPTYDGSIYIALDLMV